MAAHPGDISFDELTSEQRTAIARGWQLDPTDDADLATAGTYFVQCSPEDRWQIITASSQSSETYEREVERVAENSDPATNEAFGVITAAPTGDIVLAEVECYLTQFVAYPSEAARVAHTLWIAHTHLMHLWESTPRIAFLSPEPGSGKSRALEVSEPLVPRPVHAVNATPAYLFRKVSDEAGPPTILNDEIDTVFGPRAKDNEEVRGLLNAGHRRGAVAGRCVVKGRTVEPKSCLPTVPLPWPRVANDSRWGDRPGRRRLGTAAGHRRIGRGTVDRAGPRCGCCACCGFSVSTAEYGCSSPGRSPHCLRRRRASVDRGHSRWSYRPRGVALG